PTSGSIVLNTLINDREKYMLPYNPLKASVAQQLPRNAEVRIKMFSPDNFSSGKAKKIKTEDQIFGKPINGKRDLGLQIRQLHEMLLAHGVQSKLRIVEKTLSDKVIKNELIENLKSKNDYVVVNYKRLLLGQEGGGHISPLGAYHKPSDSFLVMDVNPDKYDWVWVKAEKLIQAMRSFDTVENRGYVLVSL
ncbi:MAG: hypothetical protein KDD50_14930, partial [Bdellovibrionales bacterium]|nr:hypothetical protein [Bdellovibrionales bacterium]